LLPLLVISGVTIGFISNVNAQNVGINNPTPHAKSILDITAGDKGLLAPRMTQAQRISNVSGF
jgi:hypothetical protein